MSIGYISVDSWPGWTEDETATTNLKPLSSQPEYWTNFNLSPKSFIVLIIKMYKFIFSIIAIITLYNFVDGLSDVGSATYSSSLVTRCGRFNSGEAPSPRTVARQVIGLPRCCSGGCKIKYSMTGSWATTLDRKATRSTCFGSCRRHFRKCYGKCRCMAFLSEIRSSNQCKCVRSLSRPGLIRKCRDSCRAGYQSCMTGCVTNRCPLTARTSVNFSTVSGGKCGTVCNDRCLVPFPLKSIDEEDTTPIPADIDPLG